MQVLFVWVLSTLAEKFLQLLNFCKWTLETPSFDLLLTTDGDVT